MKNELWWKDFFRGPWEQVQLPGYPEQRTTAEVAFMIGALELRSGARILDVPCGEGRHAIGLAQRGFDVVGIDFNEKAIAIAKQHITKAKLDVSFVVGDMRELDVLIGLIAAVALGRVILALLYGVSAADPATLVAASVIFLAVATLASMLPAARAAGTAPADALRAC
ncbi:MAG: methyltransferase domain-containing protein [Longimicrobiales bacterium]